jgi:hypothetical protein
MYPGVTDLAALVRVLWVVSPQTRLMARRTFGLAGCLAANQMTACDHQDSPQQDERP